MKRHKFFPSFTAIAFLSISALPAHGTITTFIAELDNGKTGANWHMLPGMGYGSVVLDDVTDTITVNGYWYWLTSPAIVAEIHGPALVGFDAGVLFTLTGVPQTTAGSIPEQVFTLTPSQVADLEHTRYYLNIGTVNYPSGEIRGQLVALPEMSSAWAGVLAMGTLCFSGKIFGKGRGLAKF